MPLTGKTIFITGGAVRVGKAMALAAARAGANLILHYNSSADAARNTIAEILELGVQAELIQANLNKREEVYDSFQEAEEFFGSIDILINNAAIFEPLDFLNTDLDEWQRHMQINLTAPFMLSQAFVNNLAKNKKGRILNILDWRALRPGADHFPYTVSKAGLAALTQSLAVSLAPNISVNGIALGAILPPADGGNTETVLQDVPIKRWASLEELGETMLFLLAGPGYITGEIIHLDGGRHLV